MSKKGRVRLTEKNSREIKLTIKPHYVTRKKVTYTSWIVEGWKENGKRPRKQFKTEEQARAFAANKELELRGLTDAKESHLTTLTRAQIDSAELAYTKLGETYTLEEAISYFLENHRAPEYTITLTKAQGYYLDDLEGQGMRARTIQSRGSLLVNLSDYLEDPEVHLMTQAKVESFLRSRRNKDGEKIKRKTWNNYRNDLFHFFAWSKEADLTTHRPWTFKNPCEGIRVFSNKQVADEREEICVTDAEDVIDRMTRLMNYKEGVLVKYYALAYFTGIRPDGELKKLAKQEKNLINLRTRTIHIPASVSKTKQARQVKISDNLMTWLEAYKDFPIIPTNYNKLNRTYRAEVSFGRDETRHTFISYHVALHRSVGDASLQAGNSETMVKKHYLNLRPAEEGAQFFTIIPDLNAGAAIFSTDIKPTNTNKLKAI